LFLTVTVLVLIHSAFQLSHLLDFYNTVFSTMFVFLLRNNNTSGTMQLWTKYDYHTVATDSRCVIWYWSPLICIIQITSFVIMILVTTIHNNMSMSITSKTAWLITVTMKNGSYCQHY